MKSPSAKENNSLIFLLAFLSISFLSYSSVENKESLSVFDELNYKELLEVNLEFPMNNLLKDRKNPKEVKGVFSYNNSKGNLKKWEIKIAQRGKFRRTKCENMPPLKLNFKKSQLRESGLAEFDDLKLVTHCLNDFEEAKQILIREFLAYKIYNELTDLSFRVQLVKVNYYDTSSKRELSQYGILIEDTAQLRHRINAEKIGKAYNLSKEKFNQSQARVVSVFNYLIGNSDWSIQQNRNVKILLRNGRHILVPYDFDFSGFVDSPYTVLKREHKISSSKERIYLGFKEDDDELLSTFKFFQKKRNLILKVIDDCRVIDKSEKRILKRYLKSFYKLQSFNM